MVASYNAIVTTVRDMFRKIREFITKRFCKHIDVTINYYDLKYKDGYVYYQAGELKVCRNCYRIIDKEIVGATSSAMGMVDVLYNRDFCEKQELSMKRAGAIDRKAADLAVNKIILNEKRLKESD